MIMRCVGESLGRLRKVRRRREERDEERRDEDVEGEGKSDEH